MLTILKAANYTELLALDTTVFDTICDDGAIHASAVAKHVTVTESEEVLLQAAHDWFEVYGTFPIWLPEEWRP